MSQRARLGVILGAVVVVVIAFVIASSGSSDKTKSQTGPTTIVVKNGKPVGGVKDITVNKGDRVRFTVKSDVADEIHVHGYNFMKDVAKGGSVSFDFKASVDGAFVIELEHRGEQIASLKVEP